MEKYLNLADKVSDKMIEVVADSEEDCKTLLSELNQFIEPLFVLFSMKLNRSIMQDDIRNTMLSKLKGIIN